MVWAFLEVRLAVKLRRSRTAAWREPILHWDPPIPGVAPKPGNPLKSAPIWGKKTIKLLCFRHNEHADASVHVIYRSKLSTRLCRVQATVLSLCQRVTTPPPTPQQARSARAAGRAAVSVCWSYPRPRAEGLQASS